MSEEKQRNGTKLGRAAYAVEHEISPWLRLLTPMLLALVLLVVNRIYQNIDVLSDDIKTIQKSVNGNAERISKNESGIDYIIRDLDRNNRRIEREHGEP